MKSLKSTNTIATTNHANAGIAITRMIEAINGTTYNKKTVKCACPVCKAGEALEIAPAKAYPVYVGGEAAFVSYNHVEYVAGYHGTDIKTIVGSKTANGQEISCEIEIKWATASEHAKIAVLSYMKDKGFAAERDCTVDVEFTGYVARNLTGLSQIFAALMAFVEAGWIKFDRSCGCHCNISTDKMRDLYGNLSKRKMKAYLDEATKYMREHDDDLECVFGRGGYTEYASVYDTGYEGHGCALNMYHLFEINGERKQDMRFEYRICKFNGNDANRYMEMVRRLVKFTDGLMDAYANDKPYTVAYNLMAKVMKVVEV